jgi:PPOX class probable FMN-dependent enzyme
MTLTRINTLAELDALYPKPLDSSVKKELPALNVHYRKIIAASPFLTIASIGPDGMDCSPRGDSAGFVKVLDDRSLVIPERRGNNRLDTLRNIVVDPRVALLFMIPGYNETLRINGNAYLTLDSELLTQFDANGKKPNTAIVVDIERVYFQCARALKRSQLWSNSNPSDVASLPSAGTLIRSAIADFDADEYDAQLQERQAQSLY